MTMHIEKSLPDSAYEPLCQNDSDLGAPIEAEPLIFDHHLSRNTIYGFYAALFILVASNLVFLGEIIRLRSLLHSLDPQVLFCKS